MGESNRAEDKQLLASPVQQQSAVGLMLQRLLGEKAPKIQIFPVKAQW